MAPRPGVTPDAVVQAALAEVDEHGVDGLTLAAVAERLGVRTPSLYKHVDGLPALRDLLAARATDDLATALGDAALGRSGGDGVAAVASAYRRWALDHPRRYALVPVTLPAAGTAAAAASDRIVAVVVATLRSYRFDEAGAIHATRCLRAAVHGFTSLEAAGGFGLPVDLDDSFEALVTMVVAGITALAEP